MAPRAEVVVVAWSQWEDLKKLSLCPNHTLVNGLLPFSRVRHCQSLLISVEN